MYKKFETQYLELLDEIIHEGVSIDDRTGVGTYSLTNKFLETDLQYEFPLLSSKRVPFKLVAGELLWFLAGETDTRDLSMRTYGVRDKSTIWDSNATNWEDRCHQYDCGLIYGYQWRNFGRDQIMDLIKNLKIDPNSRRHVVTAWNPEELDEACLPPCHMMFQVNISKEYIDLCWFQRSADMFLGMPFNIVSYSLLLKLLAKETGLIARKCSVMVGNAHIYKTHSHQCLTMIERGVKLDSKPVVTISTGSDNKLFDLDSLYDSDLIKNISVDNFLVSGYDPYPTITGKMAV